MPDDIDRPAIGGAGSRIIDVLDCMYEFEREFKRKPTGWADYCYGMSHIGRVRAREMLGDAGVVRIAQTPDEAKWDQWLRETRAIAGFDG